MFKQTYPLLVKYVKPDETYILQVNEKWSVRVTVQSLSFWIRYLYEGGKRIILGIVFFSSNLDQ